MAELHPFYMGQKSKSENEKCKRLAEKSHKYSHCRQEKCFFSVPVPADSSLHTKK